MEKRKETMKAKDSVPLRPGLGGEYTRFLELQGRIKVVDPHGQQARAHHYWRHESTDRQQADLGLRLLQVEASLRKRPHRTSGSKDRRLLKGRLEYRSRS